MMWIGKQATRQSFRERDDPFIGKGQLDLAERFTQPSQQRSWHWLGLSWWVYIGILSILLY